MICGANDGTGSGNCCPSGYNPFNGNPCNCPGSCQCGSGANTPNPVPSVTIPSPLPALTLPPGTLPTGTGIIPSLPSLPSLPGLPSLPLPTATDILSGLSNLSDLLNVLNSTDLSNLIGLLTALIQCVTAVVQLLTALLQLLTVLLPPIIALLSSLTNVVGLTSAVPSLTGLIPISSVPALSGLSTLGNVSGVLELLKQTLDDVNSLGQRLFTVIDHLGISITALVMQALNLVSLLLSQILCRLDAIAKIQTIFTLNVFPPCEQCMNILNDSLGDTLTTLITVLRSTSPFMVIFVR